RRTYAFAEWATMHILSSWRARVWDDAMAMLHARTAAARDVIVQRMERLSRRYAKILALPSALPLHAPAGSPRTGAWAGASFFVGPRSAPLRRGSPQRLGAASAVVSLFSGLV